MTNTELQAVKDAGYTDGQIVEVVALTAQVLMTNFMNNVAQTESEVPMLKAAMAS